MAEQRLKDRLIKQARKRNGGITAEADGGLTRTRIAAKYRRFDEHPAYREIAAMRRGAKRFGVDEPFFRTHEGIAGASTEIDGHQYINFASYNYLGLNGHPRVQAAARDAMGRYGTSVSASRPVAGERPIHRELERALASTYDVADAVAFVSGHATNVSTIATLMGPQDLILYDEFIHNSAAVGAQLSGAKRLGFTHNDPSDLDAKLAAHRGRFERCLILVEGLYSMDGDTPDLAALIDAKQRHGAWLMVDEAHSFGTVGATGLGIREAQTIDPADVDIWMGTLSKTLAGCGGFIAGCQALIEMLRYLAPGFLYSVGMPAPEAAAALEALHVMRDEPQRVEQLHQRGQQFLARAQRAGLNTGTSEGYAVIPIINGSSLAATRACHALFAQGINVQPILAPAVPERSARLRFFLSSDHTAEQIDSTLERLEQHP